MVDEVAMMKHFSEYVNQRAKELEISLWYVAYYSETSETAFNKYMKCARLARPTTLIMVAELFECTVNELLGYPRVHIPRKNNKFNSGLDTKRMLEYFYSEAARLMIRKRISIDELAEYVGVTSPTLESYFKYNTLYDGSTMVRICDALECTPSELLGY